MYPASSYSSTRSCIRIRTQHKTSGSCVHRYSEYDIFRDEILKFTYIQYFIRLSIPYYMYKSYRTHVIIPSAYEVCMVYSFRRINHHINFVYVCVNLLLIGEFIGYGGPHRPSIVHPSTFLNDFFSETTGPI